MSYWQSGRYSIAEISLNVAPTPEQAKRLDALCLMADFRPATYYEHDHSISFTKFQDYEVIINFFRKVLNIIPDFEADVEITDTEEDNGYWILKIRDGEIEECFGTVFWGSKEEKDKIFKVLEARLQSGEPGVIEDITEQIVNAIRGDFDHLEDETLEEPEINQPDGELTPEQQERLQK